MQIVTNPGSNLSPEALQRYGVKLTAQSIMVDGQVHDTRDDLPLSQIDAWVKRAKLHPHVVGTTAAEFVSLFRELAKTDRQILAVLTSRKIIGTYDAAISAARTLRTVAGHGDVEIVACDTGMTDAGAGLAVTLAGEAARGGASMADVAAQIEAFREHARFVIQPDNFDYLVKGGRATAVRAWLANLLQIRPILGFRDGEVAVVDKVKASIPLEDAVSDHFVKEIGAGQPVWAAVMHGNAPERAARLMDRLERKFDVRYGTLRPLSSSIYLHAGPGSVGGAVVPLSRLPISVSSPGP